MGKKLIIIGLDGGTFDIIKPLAERGRLPFLQGIMQTGIQGVLQSTRPPVTAPAWTSFATGKNPGKHGLFDFQKMNANGEKELTYSTDCQSATFWDYLTEAGLSVLMVNIPLTFPPKPVNGVCVAGFPLPSHSDYVYPQEKLAWVQAQGYIDDWTTLMQQRRWQSRFQLLREVEQRRLAVFGKLLQQEPWDVAMVVVSGTDHISHLEWQKGNRKGVEDYYCYIDRLLKEMEDAGFFQNASLAIMSDHGFAQGEYVFYMNIWLMQQGYLAYQVSVNRNVDKFLEERQKNIYGSKGKLSYFLGKLGLTRENLIFLAKRTGLIHLEKYVPHRFISMFPASSPIPDWRKTRAYMVSDASKGININLRGREQHGIVNPAEYQGLCREIIDKLRTLRLPDGGEMFEYADLREHVYHGPFVESAPDIVLWPTKRCNILMGTWGKTPLVQITNAHHASDGIFLMRGPDIKQQQETALRLEDLVPTFLHYLGLSCPDDVDGRVLKELFLPESEPARREISLRRPIDVQRQQDLEAVDAESVANQLKALGYL